MSDFGEQEQRIAGILGEDEVPEVTDRTLKKYLVYLQKNLEFPCYLTGIEDFSWEERYVFGDSNQKEYEKLKKTQPSYKDTFECIDFNRETDEGYGHPITHKSKFPK